VPRLIDAQPPVVLVPVVEVEPYHYSSIEMPRQDATPSDWAEYFQLCMADAGFRDVAPVVPRSNFVVASSIVGNPLLERMIVEELNGTGLPGFSVMVELEDREPLDRVSPFSGGLALIAAGELLLQPNCCGDLGDVQGWKRALDTAPEPAVVWIGHPEVELEFTGDRVLLREGWEYRNRPETLVEASMPIVWLKSALDLAEVEQLRFREGLVPMVSRILGSSELARDVATRLAGRT